MGLSASRRVVLAAAESPRLGRFVRRYGFRLGASRFVAGESLDSAVPVLRGLNEKGLLTNTTLLGEGVTTEGETATVVAGYRELLDRIAAERLRTNVALKLTHLGLAFDEGRAEQETEQGLGSHLLKRQHIRVGPPDERGHVGDLRRNSHLLLVISGVEEVQQVEGGERQGHGPRP